MSRDARSSAIYQRVIDAGAEAPYAFAGPWSRLSSDAAIVRAPVEPVTLLNQLQHEFPPDALQRSGVVSRAQSGAPELNPALLGSENALLALRDPRRGGVFELLTADGCISGGALPAIAILQDTVTTDLLRNPLRPLCVAFALRDVLLLRSLGLPATLSLGLQQLGGAELEEFCRTFGLSKGPRAISENSNPKLLFVGWCPSQLSADPPEGFSATGDHFVNLHRHLGIDMRTVQVWRPSASELKALRFCLQYGSIDDVRGSIVRSMERSTEPVAPVPSRGPQNVVEAQLQFHEQQHGRHGFIDLDQAVRQFQQLFERDVVLPQLEKALAEDDPQQRGMGVVRSELLRHLEMNLTAYSQRLSQIRRATRRGRRDPLPDPELQALQREMDQVIRVISRINEAR